LNNALSLSCPKENLSPTGERLLSLPFSCGRRGWRKRAHLHLAQVVALSLNLSPQGERLLSLPFSRGRRGWGKRAHLHVAQGCALSLNLSPTGERLLIFPFSCGRRGWGKRARSSELTHPLKILDEQDIKVIKISFYCK